MKYFSLLFNTDEFGAYGSSIGSDSGGFFLQYFQCELFPQRLFSSGKTPISV